MIRGNIPEKCFCKSGASPNKKINIKYCFFLSRNNFYQPARSPSQSESKVSLYKYHWVILKQNCRDSTSILGSEFHVYSLLRKETNNPGNQRLLKCFHLYSIRITLQSVCYHTQDNTILRDPVNIFFNYFFTACGQS